MHMNHQWHKVFSPNLYSLQKLDPSNYINIVFTEFHTNIYLNVTNESRNQCHTQDLFSGGGLNIHTKLNFIGK